MTAKRRQAAIAGPHPLGSSDARKGRAAAGFFMAPLWRLEKDQPGFESLRSNQLYSFDHKSDHCGLARELSAFNLLLTS